MRFSRFSVTVSLCLAAAAFQAPVTQARVPVHALSAQMQPRPQRTAAPRPRRRPSTRHEPLGLKLARRALCYLGAPYVWGGYTPAGFDCSGFTQYVFRQFGLSLPRTAATQSDRGSYVPESRLRPGDLVFFDTAGGISHVGMYLGHGRFIHAGNTEVTIDNIHNPNYWSSRYVTARSIS